MTTEPQIYAIGIHASFLKTLSIYYYFLFFLLNSVAKKFYEIRATNFYKLCKTNPISERPKMNITSLLLTTNDQRLATREAQNKPNTNPIPCPI